MAPITATIITFNEEERIAGAIASLPCCDEVVVVDAGSTDRTRQIAEACGARVLMRKWDGYSRQKNFAASVARNDWILSIDADERLSIELAGEIRKALSAPDACAAFSMPRRAFYMGGWIRHSGWYPDRKIRLYDRRRCRWEGEFVHECVMVDGKLGILGGDLLHFPYRNWTDHLARIDKYTSLAAQSARAAGRRGSLAYLVAGPAFTFIKTLVLQGGFLDGWRGLAIAYMAARYVFLREFRILR